MGIRATYRTTGDLSLPPRFGEDGLLAGPEVVGRRVLGEDQTEHDAGVRDTPTITEILRGSDLDVMLNGVTGSDFLFGDWSVEAPSAGRDADLTRLPDLQTPIDKAANTALVLPDLPDHPTQIGDADIAQVLPGIMGDEFLLSKDADLPLVLPGDGSVVVALESSGDAEALLGFPTHMLTLLPEGGFIGETDDIGRLHDHDGWLF